MSTRNLLIICCTLLITGILFWPTLYRYDHTTVNGNILPVRINRLTGYTEWFVVGRWKPVSDSNRKQGKNIPSEEVTKIIVNANLDYSLFGGAIYNGTDWFITSITFEIIVKSSIFEGLELQDGGKLHVVGTGREYYVNVLVEPRTVSSFSTKIMFQSGETYDWKIKNATGYLK